MKEIIFIFLPVFRFVFFLPVFRFVFFLLVFRFVLPIGATINMDGTALYEVLAQYNVAHF